MAQIEEGETRRGGGVAFNNDEFRALHQEYKAALYQEYRAMRWPQSGKPVLPTTVNFTFTLPEEDFPVLVKWRVFIPSPAAAGSALRAMGDFYWVTVKDICAYAEAVQERRDAETASGPPCIPISTLASWKYLCATDIASIEHLYPEGVPYTVEAFERLNEAHVQIIWFLAQMVPAEYIAAFRRFTLEQRQPFLAQGLRRIGLLVEAAEVDALAFTTPAVLRQAESVLSNALTATKALLRTLSAKESRGVACEMVVALSGAAYDATMPEAEADGGFGPALRADAAGAYPEEGKRSARKRLRMDQFRWVIEHVPFEEAIAR